MRPAANADGWEAILGDDPDLVAFLCDEETEVVPLPPKAANDNCAAAVVCFDGEEVRVAWEPRFRTVE